jgi:hypothetical protein
LRYDGAEAAVLVFAPGGHPVCGSPIPQPHNSTATDLVNRGCDYMTAVNVHGGLVMGNSDQTATMA